MKNYLKKLLAVALAASMAMSMAAVGASAAPGYTGKVVVDRITTSKADNLSSFSGGGWTVEDDDYAYVSALFVNGGAIDERSVEEAIVAGTYSATEADGVAIKSTYEGFNPIIVHDSKYAIKNADIVIESEGDGTVTNDFSGFGSAIAAFGDSTVLTIEDSKVDVSGVANMALFVDDGADVVVKNSTFHSDGATLYADYKNSPNQATMVAPPWILGIMGSSRCTNLMGQNSSMSVVDSTTTAAQWAILSTDSGQNMTLTVVNSYMGLTGATYPLQADGSFATEYGVNGNDANPYTNKAGYGTYTIGNSNQKFYGVDMVVGTYANIYTGGTGLYTSMKAGETIELLSAQGDVVDTYTPSEDKVTHIKSDTFGFMAHQGSNSLTITEGTIVDSEYTTFIQKTGCSIDVLVEDSDLNPGNGILVQILDNDDATTGMDMATFSFYTTHTEYEGWPTEGAKSAGNASTYTFSDMELVGDIFNGSGWNLNYKGAQTATELAIVLENGTTLEGQISSTAAIHVTKEGSDAVKAAAAGAKASAEWVEYQNTSFPIGHYFDIGQVANKVQSSGLNTIDVTIDETSSWTVTADGIVRNLTAASTAIVADKPVTLTVEGTLTLDDAAVTADTTIGNVTYKLAANDVESEAVDVSKWVIGEVYAGQGETVSGANAVNYEGAAGTCRVIDGDASGDVSTGDAIVQYETYIMYGWVAADGTLTTTYPAAGEQPEQPAPPAEGEGEQPTPPEGGDGEQPAPPAEGEGEQPTPPEGGEGGEPPADDGQGNTKPEGVELPAPTGDGSFASYQAYLIACSQALWAGDGFLDIATSDVNALTEESYESGMIYTILVNDMGALSYADWQAAIAATPALASLEPDAPAMPEGGMPEGGMPGGMPEGGMPGGMPGGDQGVSSEPLPEQLVVTLEDGVVTNVEYYEPISFTDTNGHWAEADILAAAEAGVINGYEDGSFKPDKTVIRAEAAKIMALAMGEEIGSPAAGFVDVPANEWYAPYVAAAVKSGAMKGTSATTFDPTGAVTRAQAATMMVQALGLTAEGAANFSDVAADAWYADEVAAAAEAGIVKGYTDGTFKPEQTVTRAELVTMLWRAAAYEPETPDTPIAEGSDLEPVVVGSQGRPLAAPRYANELNVDGEVDINDPVSWHNGVIYNENGNYTLTGSIVMNSDADGKDTNDFSGLGAAIMTMGDELYLTIDGAYVETTGVAKCGLLSDGGSVVVVKNSDMRTNGGAIYDEYMCTVDGYFMITPPWVLGLGGTNEAPCNARTTSIMGDYTVAAYLDSYFYAAGWAALSIDSGLNMMLVAVNSEVDVEYSGYGAYNFCNSTEYFYGVDMDVSTYALISAAGEATFTSYTGGQVVEVEQFDGETNEYGNGLVGSGEIVAELVSEKVPAGEKVVTKINSDEFGFMMHSNGSTEWNVVNVLDGTEVTTGDAMFLIKKVNALVNVDNAVLESNNDTLLQIIDNDDDYVGLDFATIWGWEDGYGHSISNHTPTFNQVFNEAEGYSNEWIADTSAAATADYDTANNWVVEYNMTNTEVNGDLWNSTGYVGMNPATTLNINLGEGAALAGTISAGAFSHTTKHAEVGNGDWSQAAVLGHVTNIPNSNGVNLVNVTLSDGAVWVVEGICYIDSLTVDEASSIDYADGAQLYVGGELYGEGQKVDQPTPPEGGEGNQPTPPEGGDMPTPPEGGEGMPEMPEGGGGNGNGDPSSMATIADNGDGTYAVTLGGMEMDTYEVNGVAAVGGQTINVSAPDGTIYVKCTAQGGPNMGLEYTYTV